MPIELESLLSQFWKLSYLKRDYNRTVPMNVNIETLRPRWPFFCLDWQRGTHTKNYTFSVFPTEILMIFSINRIWWDNHCTIKKKKRLFINQRWMQIKWPLDGLIWRGSGLSCMHWVGSGTTCQTWNKRLFQVQGLNYETSDLTVLPWDPSYSPLAFHSCMSKRVMTVTIIYHLICSWWWVAKSMI